ncbi:MAG: isopentenyl-diphosphate Delta-isomerase [Acidimicrobiales bacterium]
MGGRDAVVLVDEAGEPVGTMAKRAAHEAPGHLHLAFSVFLFREGGEVLLQQRALSKYHFPGIWANACCSHPQPGEEIVSSAARRLTEELGMNSSPQLTDCGSFSYRALDESSGLVERELDHVLSGEVTGDLVLAADPTEVAALRWAAIDEVSGLGAKEGFAPWFAEGLGLALGSRQRGDRGA